MPLYVQSVQIIKAETHQDVYIRHGREMYTCLICEVNGWISTVPLLFLKWYAHSKRGVLRNDCCARTSVMVYSMY